MRSAEERLATAWWALRVGLGVGVFVAGLDKYFNLLATWSMYLSPIAERLLPVSEGLFMRCVGCVEMVVGIGVLTRWTRQSAYLLAAWLLAIAVNLAVSGNFWDLAIRDVEIAISAFALARLTEWRAALRQASGIERGGIAHLHPGGAEA